MLANSRWSCSTCKLFCAFSRSLLEINPSDAQGLLLAFCYSITSFETLRCIFAFSPFSP